MQFGTLVNVDMTYRFVNTLGQLALTSERCPFQIQICILLEPILRQRFKLNGRDHLIM